MSQEIVLFEKKKKIVNLLLKNNLLINKELLDKIDDEQKASVIYDKILEKTDTSQVTVLNEDVEKLLDGGIDDFNWQELEKNRVQLEKKGSAPVYDKMLDYASTPEPKKPETLVNSNLRPVNIIFNYAEKSRKRDVSDFVGYFTVRYKALKNILMNRQELQSSISINKILNKKDRESVACIGLIKEKNITKNNNIRLVIEDPTGEIGVIVNKNKPDIFDMVNNCVEDEVIGISGTSGEKIIFANNVFLPDIPIHKELKKSPVEEYALFLSDLHVGSGLFLEEDFLKFIKWLRGEVGSDEQKSIASKVSYIFIAGDLVAGIGIYPGMEDDLKIDDIYKQYQKCTELLALIPKNIQIIVQAGNHDPMRMSEPQPVLNESFAPELFKMSNLTFVSNPAIINFGGTKDFSGFNMLMYHGYSLVYYVNNVATLRQNGGYERADLVMKYLLQRRHLAPTHSSTLYVPDPKNDNLVISQVPDFFLTGHIHYTSAANYRNVTMICGSCWEPMTDFQIKTGHEKIQPSRVPIVNLQTRDVKILKFGSD
ncbi:hypothetical protein GOV04_02270 [Candidatus Woesearchaeota archaeon]|nr:hypothetical protein [Candidatus Woesearchaeota archaeon]